ncbi:MAG TPA: DUF3352 domain-containing protein [Candidatus Gracilibacteria bacterium]|nr:DUF3352 domain-containing protein [Candidatus Gracilibacteria bacterium]
MFKSLSQSFQHPIFNSIQRQIYLAILVLINILVVLVFLSKFWYGSSFYRYLPANTSRFWHWQLQYTDPQLAKISPLFFQKSWNFLDFEHLPKLAGKHLSLGEDQNQNSWLMLEGVNHHEIDDFLSKISLSQSKLNWKNNHITLTSPLPFYCQSRSRKLFCHSDPNYQTWSKNQFPYLNELNRLPLALTHYTWYWDNQVKTAPLPIANALSVQRLYGSFKRESSQTIKAQIYLKTEQNYPSPTKMSRSLGNTFAQHFPSSTSFFFGGQNFQTQWQNTYNFYEKTQASYALLLKGVIQGQIAKYFGNEISFEADLLSNFKNNYALGAIPPQKDFPHWQWGFISQGDQFSTLQKLRSAFLKQNQIQMIQAQDYQIDDKTTISSISIDPQRIKSFSQKGDNFQIEGSQIKDQNWGIFIAKNSEYTVLSNSLELSKKLLHKSPHNLSNFFPQHLSQSYEFGLIQSPISQLFPFLNYSDLFHKIAWESQTYPGGISIWSRIELPTSGPANN